MISIIGNSRVKCARVVLGVAACVLACVFMLVGVGCLGSDNASPVDGGVRADVWGDADAGVWWYSCFPEGAPLCGLDRDLPVALAQEPTSWASTPLQSVVGGGWSFSVEDTQGYLGAPPVAWTVDATWISSVALDPLGTWADGELYPPRTLISFETADGTGALRVALDATDLAHIPAGELLELTLFQGLEVARGGDGVLLFALVDTQDWVAFLPDRPAPRTMAGAGLTFSLDAESYCFGAEGLPQGNRQFGFDSLVVQGGASEEILEPGESVEVTTSSGTYRVHHIAGWHRDGACLQYSDDNPWRISYEVLLVQ